MVHAQLLFTVFCIVFTCLGWRIITEPGQIFYCVRKPFEGLHERIENIVELIKMVPASGITKLDILKLKLKYYIAKPMVLCITCMASVWGATIFIVINGITLSIAPYLIFCCLSAAFIQTFIWNLYEKYL